MTNIKVTITPSFYTLAKRFGNVRVTKFLGEQIKKLAFMIERESKQRTPVDTGRLRASIRVSPKITPLQQIIQPNTNYAFFVHEGTRYMRARPFMTLGSKEASKQFEPMFAKDLEKQFKGSLK